jgi:hypothetical protein
VIVIVSAVFCYVIFNVYIMYMINRLFRVFHNCYVLHERLHLFRSNVEPVENMPRVDWNSLHIVETHDDEGRIALLSENQIYALLGLREEGTTNESEYVEHGVDNDDDCFRTSDVLPSEMVISYDKDHPIMDIGTIYPTMEEFKMAVRQFAINEEFTLGTEKSDKKRYRCFCKSSLDCPWKINGTKHKEESIVEVNIFFLFPIII